jgi:hypothetical protein
LNEELLKIFNELLEEWEDANYDCIQEFSTDSSRDYKELEQRKQNYIERFSKALNK